MNLQKMNLQDGWCLIPSLVFGWADLSEPAVAEGVDRKQSGNSEESRRNRRNRTGPATNLSNTATLDLTRFWWQSLHGGS
jgi:hypothetical protein